MNRYFHIWKESIYHERKHGETKQTPNKRWDECEQPLVNVPFYELKKTFYWEEDRKVDNTGCISFQGNKYEVESQLVEEYITIRFNPNNIEKLEVWFEGKQYENAIPLNLSRPKHKKVASNEAIIVNDESGLNYLELTAPNHELKQKEQRGALSYQSLVEKKEK